MSQARRRELAHKRAAHRRWIWAGLAMVVVTAAIIAVVAGRSSSKAPAAAGIEQTRPVDVSGALPTFASDGTDTAIGQAVPTINGHSFDGASVSIEPNGRPKVVIVAAHWCPHCQAELPRVATYLAQHPDAATGIDITVVSTDVSSSRPNYPPGEWLAGINWPTPVIADDDNGRAAQALGTSSFPYFVVAGANNQVVARRSGELAIDEFSALLEQARTAARA